MEAFAALGYKPEQVTTILLTHKHGDHSGELRSFPNAKIYVNEEELSAEELQGIPNIVPVQFTDGAYYNFPACQKIRDGIYLIRAKGHTNGNSIVIIEDDGLFFMKKRRNFRKRNPPCRRAEGILYLGVITMFDPEGFIPESGT